MRHFSVSAMAALALLTAVVCGGRSLLAASATDAIAAVDIGTPLPPLDLGGMALWNWDAKWHPSNWDNSNSPIPWRADHIASGSDGSVAFKLDAGGAPQLQGLNGTPASKRGIWEADVTLPELREGLIVAPLWLYDPDSRDEIDFEFAGRRGLDVSLHSYVGGNHKQDTVRLFSGQDFSGRRMRFAIAADLDTGIIDMLVDGRRVHRWERKTVPFFLSRPLKPRIELWAAKPESSGFVSWVGRWEGLPRGKSLMMTVHGYRFRALSPL